MTSTALVTGASRGLGLALATALSARCWQLVVDGRDGARLATAVAGLPSPGPVTALPGDVADPAHRAALAAAAGDRLELLVNNASDLGPSPLPALADLRIEDLQAVLEVNTLAPLALVQLTLPALRRARGTGLDGSSHAPPGGHPRGGGHRAGKG